MSYFTPSGSAGTTTSTVITGATNPTVANVTIPLASTEVSYTLPTGTKMFLIRTRGLAKMQLSYTVGTSGTTYVTIPANANYCTEGLTLPVGVTLYFQTNIASQIAEIVSWT